MKAFFTTCHLLGIKMKICLNVALMILTLGIGHLSFSDAQAADKRSNDASVATKNASTATKKVAKPAASKSVAVKEKKKPKIAKHGKPGVPKLAKNPGRLAVQSGVALVVEQKDGEALFQKNASQVAPIASITKLMTAMVVLDGSPGLQTPIMITDDDIDRLRGSSSHLPVGSIVTRETALLLALMSSENRAAHALGRQYPGGMPAFVSAMNSKARELGMLDTHFEDPTGLTSNNVSTAVDLARMVTAAYKYPLIRELTTTAEAKVDIGGQDRMFRNTNPLVRSTQWDVGLSKTGYISEAGKCLVMQARLADKSVVIVLLDSSGKMTRVGDANRIKHWMEGVYTSSKQVKDILTTQKNNRTPS